MAMVEEIPSNSDVELDVVCNTHNVETVDAKWLRIKDIYPKLLHYRDYNIGGTYSYGTSEYWFYFKTDQLGDNYLLHLFMLNHQECSYSVKISENSYLTHVNNKNGSTKSRSILPPCQKVRNFKNSTGNAINLITTFSFDSYDLDQLRGNDLFIPIRVKTGPYPDPTINKLFTDVKFEHDLSGLLKDPIFTDFTIESFEGCQFKVHRSVLIAQSEVFRAMLKKDTAESQNSIARLQFNKEEIEQMLEYIYTGTINDMSACDNNTLLMLADHYDLQGLSVLIQNSICSQINEDNVIDLYNLAEMHNCESLKNAAFKYIKKNAKTMLQSDSWKSLNNAALIKQIIVLISSK